MQQSMDNSEMANQTQPEVWLRGPIADIPPLLQPVAHSLMQCREELRAIIPTLTADQFWERPADAASIGFHLRHAAGSLDRLFTYARGEMLSVAQRAAFAAEGAADLAPHPAVRFLADFEETVDRALAQLRRTREDTLLEGRGVGRAQLPSTVLGLLVHAAEHTQRHVGQIVTTIKVLGGRPERIATDGHD
jgi:uncharacterized damage-inducible protein DinB